jgi:hypothetical protein
MPIPTAIVRAVAAATFCLATPVIADDQEHLARLIEAWLTSPHGNYHSPSFTYWNRDGEVPVACAACHSQAGFIDFLGADGSTPGAVDRPAAINAPIGCASCHTSQAHALSAVRFPSGITIQDLGSSAVCTVCHQGRQSGDAVAAASRRLAEDEVSADLAFLNIHYGVAAAVMYGSQVSGGYQYPGRDYAGRFAHVPSANTCVACHDAHSTVVETDGCLACHRGVTSIRDIRTRHGDFDGDGDRSRGVHAEIAGLTERLHDAILLYAREVSGAPIGYAQRFPYFFRDSDGDGRIDEIEAVPANRYDRWTPRLLKAAYNYQVARKDPGGYVHNPTYLLQILHDSLESLAERVSMDIGAISRP